MVIPISSVYALHTTVVTVDSNGEGKTIFEIGNNEFLKTPTGTVGTDNGHFIAYTFRDGTLDTTILFSSSTDGVTYTEPLTITSTPDGFGYQIRNLAIFEDSGIVDMLWMEDDGGGGSPSDIKHIRSTNGGTSFGSVNIVISTAVGFDNTDAMWFTVSGNNIGVLYSNGDTGNLEFKKSINGGTSFGGAVTVNNGLGEGDLPDGNDYRNLVLATNVATTVYWAMYTATDKANFDKDVYSQYSADGGASWTTPINLSSAQGTSAGLFFQSHLFVDGTNITAIFNGLGGGGVAYLSQARSTNSGVSFSAQEDIELGIVCNWANAGRSHVVTQTGSTFHAVCIGFQNNGIQTAKTTNNGVSWSSFSQVAFDGARAVAVPLIVKATDSLVTFTWKDIGRDGTSYRTSENGGATFNAESNFQEDSPINFTNMVHSGLNVFIAGVSSGLLSFFEAFSPPDSDIPVITLVGDNPQFVTLNDEFSDLGATCQDPTQGNVDGNVSQENNVNTSIAGNYLQEYDCDDGVGNFAVSVPRTITVLDDTDNPTITLLGSSIETMLVNAVYLDAGAVCSDPTEGNIDGNIVVTTDGLTTTIVGSNNIVEYDCQDTAGNDAPTVTRQIIVQKQSTGISSGTTSGSSQGSGGTTSVQTLADIPAPVTPTPQPTTIPTLSFGNGDGSGEGFSIADFFRNLFGQRLDATTGETVSQGVQDSQLGQVVSSSTGQPSTTGQPSNAGLSIVNAIQNFFANIFG